MEKCGNIKLSENIMGETMSWRKKEKKRERKLEDMLTPKDEETIEIKEDMVEQANSEEKVDKESLIPVRCFGMSEEKTAKWLLCCVKVWYYVMSFMWFLLGAVTFAPVIFISNNVNAIFKSKKKSLLCGIIVYAIFLSIIVFCIVTRTK